MGLFGDFSEFALLTDAIEFKRYYELYTAKDGTEYINEISERTFEKRCERQYVVLQVMKYESKQYVFMRDTQDMQGDMIISRFERGSKNRVILYEVDDKTMRALVRIYKQL